MKTKIDLSDHLLQSAKQLTQDSRTPLRTLLEEDVYREQAQLIAKPKQAFKLKNASVRGKAVRLTDPREWQSQETEHLTRTLSYPVKR